jgi:hypothetical protein
MSKKPKKPALKPDLILGTIPLAAERAKAVKSGRAKKDDRKASEQKFGKPVIEIGFTVIPSCYYRLKNVWDFHLSNSILSFSSWIFGGNPETNHIQAKNASPTVCN